MLLITDRGSSQVSREVKYQVYMIEGSETKYKIYEDGTVTQYLNNEFVTKGGLDGLVKLFSRSISSYTTQNGCQIALDKYNGMQYFVYEDGRVTQIDGTFVTVGGIEGLNHHLMKQVVTQKITATNPDYQIVTTSNGNTFLVRSNGRVCLRDGSLVITGGIEGLKTHLTKTYPSTVVTISSTTVPTYKIFTYNEEQYILYPNNTITSQKSDTIITTAGLDGFYSWITNRAISAKQTQTSFQTYTCSLTGDQFYIYDNQTVTTK